MKLFKDLTVKGAPDALDTLADRLGAVPDGPEWKVRPDLAQKLQDLNPDDRRAVVFDFVGKSEPSASVFLLFDEDAARVTNVVPVDKSELSYAEYNAIVDRFNELLISTGADIGLQVDVGAESLDISDVLSPDAARALRDFSAGANRSTGAAHPMDAERWREFLVLAHMNNDKLGPSQLAQWLVEDERWGDEQAMDLSIQYESGRALLQAYDAMRRG